VAGVTVERFALVGFLALRARWMASRIGEMGKVITVGGNGLYRFTLRLIQIGSRGAEEQGSRGERICISNFVKWY
jgi:hypothetical protein